MHNLLACIMNYGMVFNCEDLLIANCEFTPHSQLRDSQHNVTYTISFVPRPLPTRQKGLYTPTVHVQDYP